MMTEGHGLVMTVCGGDASSSCEKLSVDWLTLTHYLQI